jgi:hypothetical protein
MAVEVRGGRLAYDALRTCRATNPENEAVPLKVWGASTSTNGVISQKGTMNRLIIYLHIIIFLD